MCMPSDGEARQHELDNSAAAVHASDSMAATVEGPRCVNGQLLHSPTHCVVRDETAHSTSRHEVTTQKEILTPPRSTSSFS